MIPPFQPKKISSDEIEAFGEPRFSPEEVHANLLTRLQRLKLSPSEGGYPLELQNSNGYNRRKASESILCFYALKLSEVAGPDFELSSMERNELKKGILLAGVRDRLEKLLIQQLVGLGLGGFC